MIPRYRPYARLRDLFKYLLSPVVTKEEVEKDFARKAGARFALMLPYGRSAYYFLLKAYGIKHKEVIVPAYTCYTNLLTRCSQKCFKSPIRLYSLYIMLAVWYYCIPGPILETNNKPVFIRCDAQ